MEVRPGTTPLQMLSHAGAVRCAEFLIKHGASPGTYDCDGFTALLVACSPGGPKSGSNGDIVQLLLDAGARANHKNSVGFTPLSAAGQSRDLRSLRLLLEAGGDLGVRCAQGFSPVIWALIGSESDEESSAESIHSKQATVIARHSYLLRNEEYAACVHELITYADIGFDRVSGGRDIRMEALSDILEDLKTFQFSKFLLQLTRVAQAQIQSYSLRNEVSAAEMARTMPEDLRKQIDKALVDLLVLVVGNQEAKRGTSLDMLSLSELGDAESIGQHNLSHCKLGIHLEPFPDYYLSDI